MLRKILFIDLGFVAQLFACGAIGWCGFWGVNEVLNAAANVEWHEKCRELNAKMERNRRLWQMEVARQEELKELEEETTTANFQ
jgi:hypothetical protein